MLEREQVLAPEMIEHLQQNRFLDIAHHVGAHWATLAAMCSSALRTTRAVSSSSAMPSSLATRRPAIEIEHARKLLLQALGVPLLR